MKYLYINDISYLLKKRIKMLIPLFFLPIIVMLININVPMKITSYINSCMGTNMAYHIDELILIEALMFLFNIFVYIFLIADIYVKDISYQLDNIFLRMKAAKWILKKNIVFILLTVLLKFLQYVLILTTLLIFKNDNVFTFSVFNLFFKDLFYTIFVQFLFISIYIISSSIKKNKLVPYIIFCIIMIFIPKNIYKLNFNNNIIIGISLIIIFIVLQIVFKKYNKRIIENV